MNVELEYLKQYLRDTEDSEWPGNFTVVYEKGTYEITLLCDKGGEARVE